MEVYRLLVQSLLKWLCQIQIQQGRVIRRTVLPRTGHTLPWVLSVLLTYATDDSDGPRQSILPSSVSIPVYVVIQLLKVLG